MLPLYVENVPDDLHEALRTRAREHGRSISAEVLALLEETVPTPAVLKRRKKFLRRALRIRPSRKKGPFQSAEEILREDRLR